MYYYYIYVYHNNINDYILKSTPYNQWTVVGYIITWLTQCWGILASALVFSAATCMFFGICWYCEALFDDMFAIIKETDDNIHLRSKIHVLSDLKYIILYHNRIIRYSIHAYL